MPARMTGTFPKTKAMKKNFHSALSRQGHKAGKLLVTTVQQGIASGNKSGRLYNGIRAGAPGEFSANRTGALLNSADYTVQGYRRVIVTLGAPHALFQEAGTSKMSPRPNLRKAYLEIKGTIYHYFTRVFRKLQ